MFSLQFDETQLEIQSLAKDFATNEIAPTAISRDANAEFPTDILKKMGELGFMGMMVDPEYGGTGLDTLSYVLALEEFAKADASVATITSVQNSLINWIIESHGTEEQKQKYLPKLASGEWLGAYCLSEPEAGSDARQQSTTAEKKDGKWIVNGLKNWISTAKQADVFVVFAQSDPGLKHKGICCFILDSTMPGIGFGAKEEKMGLKSSHTFSLTLDNVEVPEENVVGSVGEGFYIAMRGLTGGRIGIAAQAVGIAEGAFQKALQYSTERKTMGIPICDHQMIQQKLAQMSMKINAARALVHKAAWLKQNNMDCNRASSEAKLYASTIANEVTKEAVQIHGGYGYVQEYEVERMMRDAKVTEIYEGTSEIQHIVIARDLIKKLS
ncbi:MAG: acyl-CoA dehydrogenase family protein [Candidatus Kapaibacteriales bacterium]